MLHENFGLVPDRRLIYFSFSLFFFLNTIYLKLMNAVKPINPSDFINFQGHNKLIVPFWSSKSLARWKQVIKHTFFAGNVTGKKNW